MANALALAMIILAVGVIGQGILPMVAAEAPQKAQSQAPSGRNFQKGSILPVGENLPCTLCKKLIELTKDFIVNSTYVDGLVQLLHSLCDEVFPQGEDRKTCNDSVDEIPKLLKVFTDEYLDPKRDCAYVCSDPEVDQLRNIIGDLANRLK